MQKRLPLILLLTFTTIVFISTSFQPSLLDDADSAQAQAAKEILQANDWVTLHINGVRYLEKAPWLYWSVAVSLKIFGVNQFAVRFPTAVAVILLPYFSYLFGR